MIILTIKKLILSRQCKYLLSVSVFICLVAVGLSGYCEIDASSLPASTLLERAIISAREGEQTEALRLIREAWAQEPHTPQMNFDYMAILSWNGQCAEAVKLYEGQAPDTVIPDYALREIAKCYRFTGEFKKATSLYAAYLERNPNDTDALDGFIYTYLDAGQFDEVSNYVIKHMGNDKKLNERLTSYLADLLLRKNKLSEAEYIYRKVLYGNLRNVRAQLGMCRIFIEKKKYDKAEYLINHVLKQDPKNMEALIYKGGVLEAKREFLAAYRLYEDILRIYPGSQIILNLKYRALVNMGCVSLAREKLRESGEAVDEGVLQALAGDEAMQDIRWQEPDAALQIFKRNRGEYEMNNRKIQTAQASNQEKPLKRIDYDTLVALRAKDQMQRIATLNEEELVLQELQSDKEWEQLPPWVEVAIGDAYLYLRKPLVALVYYANALKQHWDPNGSTRMSMYYTFIELGQYKQAGELLDELDKEMPVQIVDRGILQDNLGKEQAAVNRGWWLLYQDRLGEAQKYLNEFLGRAPFDTNIRTALAHAYLWRGWPRLAQEEFEINGTLDPKDTAAQIGYCYALDEIDFGDQARALAKQLLEKFPTNKHVQQLNRYFQVQDMRTVTVDAGWSHENPGVDELAWSVRFEQPVYPWRNLFVQYIWRDISEDGLEDSLRRVLAGLDWRLNRDWWAVASVSADEDGDNFGYAASLTVNPNDYLSFTGMYDSSSLAVPSRARVDGIDAEEWGLRARSRRNENFIAEVAASTINFSDGNDMYAYSGRIDHALTTHAYWKTRLAWEGYANNYSDQDVPYYSPEHVYYAYLVPMLEHTWYRRYEKALVDRFYLGVGEEWERGFSSENVGYIRYEQDYRFSDTFSFLVGATLSRKYYDGEATDAQVYYLTLRKHF